MKSGFAGPELQRNQQFEPASDSASVSCVALHFYPCSSVFICGRQLFDLKPGHPGDLIDVR